MGTEPGCEVGNVPFYNSKSTIVIAVLLGTFYDVLDVQVYDVVFSCEQQSR